MDNTKLIKLLRKHEGERLFPYKCPAGRLTIGVGRNLQDRGISVEESKVLLETDIDVVVKDLQKIFNEDFLNLPGNIQLVLADMRFNLGPSRFRRFKKLIFAVNKKNWLDMKMQMRESIWFYQVGNRAEDLLKLVDRVVIKEGNREK